MWAQLVGTSASAMAPLAAALWPVPVVPPVRALSHDRVRMRAATAALDSAGGDHLFEVTVERPLGVKFQEKEGVGVIVTMVYEGSNAFDAGIAPGDVVIATSASIGSGMWPKATVDGVEAAIKTRLDGRVRLRLSRPSAAEMRERAAAAAEARLGHPPQGTGAKPE